MVLISMRQKILRSSITIMTAKTKIKATMITVRIKVQDKVMRSQGTTMSEGVGVTILVLIR